MKSASLSRIAPGPGATSGRGSVFYEAAPLAYLNLDAQGRLADLNPAAARLLGGCRERDLHRPLADFIHSRHWRRLEKHLQRIRESHDPVTTRLKLRGDGEADLTTRPETEALYFRSLMIPVVREKTAATPAGDAKFRALVENSTEVICIGAPDGTIFYTTPAVHRVLGYSPESWFGRNAFEIMRPDQAALARVAVRQLSATPMGTVLRLVAQVRHVDGSWRWVEGVLTNLIGQPDVGGIVCNYRDITDARDSEQALRASEQRYRLLAESLPQMISIRDSQGHIEYCNSHWREYRGIGGDGIIHDWRAGIPEEDLSALRPPPWENNMPRQWEAEVRIRRASDGALRWHSVRVVPLPRHGGAGARWLAIANDIHERKQADQDRDRLLEQLKRERADLAAQYAVVRVLAETSSLEDAAPPLLGAFCEQLGWEAGALWTVSIPEDGRRGPMTLNPLSLRHLAGATAETLFAKSNPGPLRKGESLAGRVWEQKKPLYTNHLPLRRGAVHCRAAAALGLRCTFAFPILLDGNVQGVVELFRRDPVAPGLRLLDIVAAIGIQIGHFIQRTGALEMLRQSEEALIQMNNAL
ncbi:MAG TPA: PAS domain S-box protein, partial [Chthoniobacteraceae bacterium]|nr:PAS domain S-box protein [Chthoniobacteraceae bacterium]